MFYKRTKATQSFLITSQHCIYWDEGSRRWVGGRGGVGEGWRWLQLVYRYQALSIKVWVLQLVQSMHLNTS